MIILSPGKVYGCHRSHVNEPALALKISQYAFQSFQSRPMTGMCHERSSGPRY
jgi:hypothetical protein